MVPNVLGVAVVYSCLKWTTGKSANNQALQMVGGCFGANNWAAQMSKHASKVITYNKQ